MWIFFGIISSLDIFKVKDTRVKNITDEYLEMYSILGNENTLVYNFNRKVFF